MFDIFQTNMPWVTTWRPGNAGETLAPGWVRRWSPGEGTNRWIKICSHWWLPEVVPGQAVSSPFRKFSEEAKRPHGFSYNARWCLIYYHIYIICTYIIMDYIYIYTYLHIYIFTLFVWTTSDPLPTMRPIASKLSCLFLGATPDWGGAHFASEVVGKHTFQSFISPPLMQAGSYNNCELEVKTYFDLQASLLEVIK